MILLHVAYWHFSDLPIVKRMSALRRTGDVVTNSDDSPHPESGMPSQRTRCYHVAVAKLASA